MATKFGTVTQFDHLYPGTLYGCSLVTSTLAVSVEAGDILCYLCLLQGTDVQIMGPIFETYNSKVVIGLSSPFPSVYLTKFRKSGLILTLIDRFTHLMYRVRFPKTRCIKWQDSLLKTGNKTANINITRMWANVQRDGSPAEYRWSPVFNAAKFGWHPLPECRAVTLPRRESRWNLLRCPKLANRSQSLVGRSSPYCENMWGRYCCLTIFLDCRQMP